MGYIIGLVIVLLIVPLIVMMVTRRTTGTGGIDSADHGISPDRPSSDQPTPRAGPGKDKLIPPG